jgi:hypothetical protein
MKEITVWEDSGFILATPIEDALELIDRAS